jgi:multidrug efflux pump subunit AcrA (membrane-fusion protein)
VVGVYVVDDDGRVRLRQVRIGNPIADGRFVVLSGLDEGERVALDPQAAVRVLIKQRKEPVSHEE